MIINISFDSSVTGAPAAFKTVVNSAVQFLENLFTGPITINIAVGYGEVNGQSLRSGSLGESEAFLSSYSYSSIKSALSSINPNVAGTLPASAPGSMWLTTADAKVLGLAGQNGSTDGFVGFSNTQNIFDYDDSDGVSAGEYDFFGVVLHEITEVMGRIDLFGATVGTTPNSYTLLDLLHYTSPGTHTYTGGTTNYFSIDGGTTNLANFNTNTNGDSGDWASSVGNDSFLAFSNSGVVNGFSSADLAVMNALGYVSAFHTVRAWDLNWSVIATGDFNHDGTADVIWDNGNGVEGGWLMSNGQVAGTLQLPFFPGWQVLATGDFNGDGTTDIMWQSTDGLVAEWFMGRGTRQGTAAIQNMAGWHVIASGDFNHDGIGDVIWDNGAGVEGGWLMGPNGQIAGTLQLPFFPGWVVLATGDFNHDGNTDILWQAANGLVAEWFMGKGTRQATLSLGIVSGWSVIATGDFNHDGTTDIMWRDVSGNTVAWLMNNGNIAAMVNYGSTIGWHVVAFGDFNGDGFGDIMWENDSSGLVATWNFTTSAQLTSGAATRSLDNVTVNSSTITEKVSGGLIPIDGGQTLTLKDGATIQGASGVKGAISNSGTIEVAGAAALLDDILTNIGTGSILQVDDGQTLTLSGTEIIGRIIKDGTVSGTLIGDLTVYGSIDVIRDSVIDGNATLNDGTVTVESGVTLRLDIVTVTGTIFSDAIDTILVVDLANTLTLWGVTINGGTVTDNGNIEIIYDSTINNAALNGGQVTVEYGQTLTLYNTAVTGTTFAGNYATINISGEHENLTLSGDHDSMSITGSGAIVTVSGAYDTLTLSGSGNAVNLTGTSDTVRLVSDHASLSLAANSDFINVTGDYDTLTLSGNNEVVTLLGSSDTVNLVSNNSSLSVAATSDTIGIAGDNDTPTLTCNGNTVTLSGSNDTFNFASSFSSVSVTATTDTIRLNGSHDTLTIGDANNTIDLVGNHETVVFNFANVGNGTVNSFDVFSDRLEFNHSQFTMFANDQAILDAAQDDGHGNTVITIGDNDSITLTGIHKSQLTVHDLHLI
jgi:hypothetical protein